MSFHNSPDGSDQLVHSILDVFSKDNFDNTIIVAESTSVYDFHVCSYLMNQLSLMNTSVQVYSVNAKTIANYRKSYIETEKTDPGDAFTYPDNIITIIAIAIKTPTIIFGFSNSISP